ncbi:hypothetical protein ACWDZ4_20610 [Streptomyces sp. NPDC003016]
MQYDIDLDAERREVQYPDGFNLLIRGHGFHFPAELPADALDPLLSDDLDLVGLLGDLAKAQGGSAVGDVIELLFKRPRLPKKFLEAVKDTYLILLGEEAFERYLSLHPSIGDYVRMTKRVSRVYGIDLGKLFGLGGSSESEGETSNPTSPDSTTSTHEESGSAQTSPDSSDSVA